MKIYSNEEFKLSSGDFIECLDCEDKSTRKRFMYGRSHVGQVPFEYIVDMDDFNFYGLEEDYQGDLFTTEDMLFELLESLKYYPTNIIPKDRVTITIN